MGENIKDHDGMYELKQVSIRIRLSEAPSLYSTEPVSTPDDAVRVMAEALAEMDREYCCVVNLDNKNRAINFNVVSIGDVNASIVPIQNAFKAAILSNATSLMLLHNHISGVLEPSGDDMLVTKRIIEAGKIMNIPVVDHLIVAGGSGRFYSFRENHPDMFNVTVTEAVREAQIRDRGMNVAGENSGAVKASNKASKIDEKAQEISDQGQSDHKMRIRDKLQEYRPLAKVEELLEENYNQIDNQLSNTAPGDDTAEKRRKESRKNATEQGASDKKASMKQRLLERQRQVAQQSPPKEAKPKHEVREL